MNDAFSTLAPLRLLVVVLLVLTVGGIATVMRLHWRAYRLLRAAPGGKVAGLTPLHVTLVSLGVLIWGVALAWGLIEQLRQAFTPSILARIILYGVGAVVILAALIVVGQLQRRRVRFTRGCTRVMVAQDEQVAVEVEDPTIETRD